MIDGFRYDVSQVPVRTKFSYSYYRCCHHKYCVPGMIGAFCRTMSFSKWLFLRIRDLRLEIYSLHGHVLLDRVCIRAFEVDYDWWKPSINPNFKIYASKEHSGKKFSIHCRAKDRFEAQQWRKALSLSITRREERIGDHLIDEILDLYRDSVSSNENNWASSPFVNQVSFSGEVSCVYQSTTPELAVYIRFCPYDHELYHELWDGDFPMLVEVAHSEKTVSSPPRQHRHSRPVPHFLLRATARLPLHIFRGISFQTNTITTRSTSPWLYNIQFIALEICRHSKGQAYKISKKSRSGATALRIYALEQRKKGRFVGWKKGLGQMYPQWTGTERALQFWHWYRVIVRTYLVAQLSRLWWWYSGGKSHEWSGEVLHLLQLKLY